MADPLKILKDLSARAREEDPPRIDVTSRVVLRLSRRSTREETSMPGGFSSRARADKSFRIFIRSAIPLPPYPYLFKKRFEFLSCPMEPNFDQRPIPAGSGRNFLNVTFLKIEKG